MQISDDGYIKYRIHWKDEPLIETVEWQDLNICRRLLFQHRLIGIYLDGVGFGNISCRLGNTAEFLITGTQTGVKPDLELNDYSLVYAADIERNELYCKGGIKASSEALTHAAIYDADPNINTVLHVHHPAMWQHLLNTVTTIHADIAYGTPELAYAVQHAIQSDEELQKEKIFVTAGHTDGIFAFGNNLTEVTQNLMDRFHQMEAANKFKM